MDALQIFEIFILFTLGVACGYVVGNWFFSWYLPEHFAKKQDLIRKDLKRP